MIHKRGFQHIVVGHSSLNFMQLTEAKYWLPVVDGLLITVSSGIYIYHIYKHDHYREKFSFPTSTIMIQQN